MLPQQGRLPVSRLGGMRSLVWGSAMGNMQMGQRHGLLSKRSLDWRQRKFLLTQVRKSLLKEDLIWVLHLVALLTSISLHCLSEGSAVVNRAQSAIRDLQYTASCRFCCPYPWIIQQMVLCNSNHPQHWSSSTTTWCHLEIYPPSQLDWPSTPKWHWLETVCTSC